MRLFVVITDEPFPEMEERLKGYSPVEISPSSAWLVRSDDLSQAIAEKAGIKGENRDLSGIVLGLNEAYSGYHRSEVWEWLKRYAS
jgi:hypothetical protein